MSYRGIKTAALLLADECGLVGDDWDSNAAFICRVNELISEMCPRDIESLDRWLLGRSPEALRTLVCGDIEEMSDLDFYSPRSVRDGERLTTFLADLI